MQAAPEGIGFPHTAQIFLIERYVADATSGTDSAGAILGVISLDVSRG
ncbi:hypothetical protein [Amycolatopsis sp. SID8362]|nr:hypothetical protein [Amycolatopsis sp. SID8362]